jgi:hypothetical protein
LFLFLFNRNLIRKREEDEEDLGMLCKKERREVGEGIFLTLLATTLALSLMLKVLSTK